MISLPDYIEFTLSGNPVPAQRARVMRGGWSFTPKRTAEAEAQVGLAFVYAANGCWFEGDVRLSAWFFLGDKRRKDVDNLLKTVLDGLTKGRAWEDDSQVKEIHGFVSYDKAAPRTVVHAESMEGGRFVKAPPQPQKSPLPKRGAKK